MTPEEKRKQRDGEASMEGGLLVARIATVDVEWRHGFVSKFSRGVRGARKRRFPKTSAYAGMNFLKMEGWSELRRKQYFRMGFIYLFRDVRGNS